jgi:hypothetical protein
MRHPILTAILACAAVVAQARDSKPVDVIVYVQGINGPPSAADYGARATVTWMYRQIGVVVAWREGQPAGSRPVAAVLIQVRFVGETPDKASPDALAYAFPFADGVFPVYVEYNRISRVARNPRLEQPILEHVLAHEIGHILQGTTGHAPAGVMKGHWSSADYDSMARRPLGFTPDDVDLIRAHLRVLTTRGTP